MLMGLQAFISVQPKQLKIILKKNLKLIWEISQMMRGKLYSEESSGISQLYDYMQASKDLLEDYLWIPVVTALITNTNQLFSN